MGEGEDELNFCTLFDSNYYAQGISMIESLIRVNKKAVIFIIAMDQKCHKKLLNKKNRRLKVINITEIERNYKELKNIKIERTKPEYYFTSKGFVCHQIISNYPYIKYITYVDSDTYFFSDPEPIFNELNDASVGITKHNFHWLTSHQKKYGLYNAGWITFKNNDEGKRCLQDWMQSCLEWCHGYLHNDKYGDQKYLNYWEKRYFNVKIIENKGLNVAPWNIKNYKLIRKGGKLYVDNDPLILYHFSNLIYLSDRVFNTNLSRVFVNTSGKIKDHIYIPYLKILLKNGVKKISKKQDQKNISFKKLLITFDIYVRKLFYNDNIKIQF